MKLYCNDKIVGDLTLTQEDTPFAEGAVHPADPAAFARLINANIFLNEIVPSMECSCFVDPEDDTYAAALHDLNITERDVDAISLGRWRIEKEAARQNITLINIQPDGQIRWRWFL